MHRYAVFMRNARRFFVVAVKLIAGRLVVDYSFWTDKNSWK